MSAQNRPLPQAVLIVSFGGALMRKVLFISLLAVALASALAFSSQAARTSVAGDYVEVRTASGFAGACHYNGELMTTGRAAVWAWPHNSAEWQGTEPAGVRGLAVG